MGSYINLDLELILQEEHELCWAACIETVYRYKISPSSVGSLFQTSIRDLKNSYNSGRKNTMESNKDYYSKLFKSSNLMSIGATQYQINDFFAIEYIKIQLNNQQPIILSGINYPLLNGIYHAITLQGYFLSNVNIFWLLTCDPFNLSKTLKTAWIYFELINYQNDDNIYDFITNINDRQENNNNLNIYNPNSLYENSLSRFRGFYPAEVIQISELIIDAHCSFLQNYFGFNCDDSYEINNSYEYIKIEEKNIEELVLSGIWITKSTISIVFLPVFQNSNFLFELIFKTNQGWDKPTVTLMGIQECKGVQDIKTLVRHNNDINNNEVSNMTLTLNHENPNYSILNISPNNYLFYKVFYKSDLTIDSVGDKNKFLFAPLNDYLKRNITLKKGNLYTKIELNKFLKNE